MKAAAQRLYTWWKQRGEWCAEEGFSQLPLPWLFAGIGCFLLLFLTRSMDNLLYPGLYAEDSVHYFNKYYGGLRPFSAVFAHPNGYINLLNNFDAWLIARTDIIHQARLYQLAGLFTGLLTTCAISFSGLIRNRWLLFLTPVVLGLAGMNHIYYYVTITFQMYTVVALLLCLFLYRRQPRGIGLLSLFLLMVLLIWSGPYSVLIVPTGLLYLLLFRDRTLFTLGLVGAALAYTLSVSLVSTGHSTIMLENLLDHNVMRTWWRALLLHTFYFDTVQKPTPALWAIVILFFSSIFLLLWRDRFFVKASLLFLCICVLSWAPFLLSKKYLMYQHIFPCHQYLGQFFWLVFLLFTSDRLCRRLPAAAPVFAPVVVVAGLVLVLRIQHVHPWVAEMDIMQEIPQFLHTVKQKEPQLPQLQKENAHIRITLQIPLFPVTAIVGPNNRESREKEVITITPSLRKQR